MLSDHCMNGRRQNRQRVTQIGWAGLGNPQGQFELEGTCWRWRKKRESCVGNALRRQGTERGEMLTSRKARARTN